MILPKAYLQDYNYRIVGFASNVAVNLSFTATFDIHKAPGFPRKSGALWFLPSEK